MRCGIHVPFYLPKPYPVAFEQASHIFYNSALVKQCSKLGQDGDDWPYGEESFHWQMQLALGVDHVPVIHEMLLMERKPSGGKPRRRGSVGRYLVTDQEALNQACVDAAAVGDGMTLPLLQGFAKAFTRRYVDPPHVKALCRARSVTAVAIDRQWMSRHIFT